MKIISQFFAAIGKVINKISRPVFSPTKRGKIWWAFLGVLILVLVSGSFDSPKYYNKAINKINETLGVNISTIKETPFHLGLDLQGGTHLVYEADVSHIEESERDNAIEGVRDVIDRRVNFFGVSEPLVQTTKSGDKHRIIVELAGVKDISEAIKMIGETPLLEFKEQATLKELTTEEKEEARNFNEAQKEKAEEVIAKLKKDEDFADLVAEYSEDESSNQKQGDLGFVGSFSPFSQLYEKAKDVGTNETVFELIKNKDGYNIIQVGESREDERETYQYQISRILLKTKPEDAVPPTEQWQDTELTGKQLERAQVVFDPNTNQPQISLSFDEEGTKLFAEITGRNVGQQVAIFLDNYPITVPRVNEPIRDGNAVITGSFDIPEAKQLVQRLNSGALPVPIKLVSQQTVGATLGQDSVQKSLTAGFIGLIIVLIFMLLYYRLPGLLADLALISYAIIVLAIFKFWPITLTLAGFAGFILSIGMAVDANVLIFERLKEELKKGKPLKTAIEDGFKRAWPSIRDGNVSTLITCLILFQFGTSIIKGFAITLTVGVLVSMFSAIVITKVFMRLIVPWFEKYNWLFGKK